MIYNKIKTIKAKGLLGAVDLEWNLSGGVNILSGYNGSGKSTLLRALSQFLIYGQLSQCGSGTINRIEVESVDAAIESDDVIALNRGELTLDSDVDVVDKSVSPERYEKFCDIINTLFAPTNKTFDLSSGLDNITFDLKLGENKSIKIPYDNLSAGEKLVVSLFTSILYRPMSSILIIDEPEVSLSIEWQKTLIEDILLLNSEMQIVIATHSPAIVMRGWVDCVTELGDIITLRDI